MQSIFSRQIPQRHRVCVQCQMASNSYFTTENNKTFKGMFNLVGTHAFPFTNLQEELRRIKSANSRNATNLDRLLDKAYGRKGKLRHEMMEVLCNH